MMNLFITIIIDSVAGLLIYDIANLVPNNNSLINMVILSSPMCGYPYTI
jgi:hypothetical protein